MPPTQAPSHREIIRHFESRDRVMAGLIRRHGPLRLKRNRRYFLVLCTAIISQQISTRAAATITARFHGLFGGQRPTPGRVLAARPEALKGVGLSRQKTAYLKDLSRHFEEKIIRPQRLRFMNNDEVVLKLTAVHGIGRWTAEMFLIFSLGRMNVLPVGDLGLQAAIQNIYRLKERPGVKELRALGEKWHPLETVGTWYAWRQQDETLIAY
jgi:DNA-3-methyladenine glycosylase II